MPLILQDINISAKPGEKIGIVGRTWAGKSSIIEALFGVFEPEQGSVYRLGSHDALELGLHSLRHHLSVIPQLPFLFRGSIRLNVDPLGASTDS